MNPSSGVVFQYKPKEGAEELIYQRISDITISMKALDYLNMPDCIPTRYEVEMNADERKLYDMLKQDLLIPLKDGDIDAANAASLTGKLLQMSNGAVYDENGKARILHDHKLEALEDLIEAANGQSVLVAYWFKHDRERIINHLTKLKIPVRDIKTSDDIKDWNAGKVRSDMESRTLPADQCPPLAAGPDTGGHHPPHHHKGHSGRGCDGSLGTERHDTRKADFCRQSTAGGMRMDKILFLNEKDRNTGMRCSALSESRACSVSCWGTIRCAAPLTSK